METPDLSVVVLCYRSEDYITDFVKQLENELEEEGINYELVLVANYDRNSNERTAEIVKGIAAGNPRIMVVSREKEGKMGWDMRSGLREASGMKIAVIDGDGQMPVSDIALVYRIIKSGRYDLVKTYRAKRFDGFYRQLLSFFYNLLFRILFRPGFPTPDINSKPKVLTRVAYEKMNLVSSDWFTDAEIMIEAFRNKLRICHVSTVFYKNERRKSMVSAATIFEFVYNLFYYRLMLWRKKNR